MDVFLSIPPLVDLCVSTSPHLPTPTTVIYIVDVLSSWFIRTTPMILEPWPFSTNSSSEPSCQETLPGWKVYIHLYRQVWKQPKIEKLSSVWMFFWDIPRGIYHTDVSYGINPVQVCPQRFGGFKFVFHQIWVLTVTSHVWRAMLLWGVNDEDRKGGVGQCEQVYWSWGAMLDAKITQNPGTEAWWRQMMKGILQILFLVIITTINSSNSNPILFPS